MSVEYNKNISDFTSATNGVNLDKLQDEVWINNTITTLFLGMRSENNTDYIFIFESAISGAESTELDVIIAAHVGADAPLSELDVTKGRVKKDIDDCAGAARARYITVAPGQSAVYLAKGHEVDEYIAAGYPTDLTDYPFVEAEKNAKGGTATDNANTIKALSDAWIVLAAGIEEIRLGYKEQVDVATDVATISALGNKARALLNSV